MSRTKTPKHLLRLLSDRTLLEETLLRIAPLSEPSRIFILTNAAQIDDCRAAVPAFPAENVIAEPDKRDTAPAAALATAIARSRDPDAVCALLPADAMIRDQAALIRQLRDAVDVASKEEALVTISVRPTFPSTGYGYLKLGAAHSKGPLGSEIVKVEKFVEKPDIPTASAYVRSGTYGWNAGMFIWRASSFLNETRRLVPELATFIEEFPGDHFEDYISDRFPALPKISVDYAIMEKAAGVLAVRSEFDWDDVGTWTALPSHIGLDEKGNAIRGEATLFNSRNNLVVSADRVVALCGVDNLVIVDTPDALLICHRDAVQDIKKLQPHLPDSVR